MKKIFYVVLDGMGDWPIEELKNKTPLEAAITPNMDKLAKEGKVGLLIPVEEGVAPESDIAVISLLGYDAHKYYTGRGPLESFAEGLEVKKGDLAYRVNFATLGEGRDIKDRRVGRSLSTEEATVLSDEINSKVKLTGGTFEFKNTIGHRGVLVIRSDKGVLSGWVTNTDPAYEREGVFGVALEEFEPVWQESKPLPGHEDDAAAKESARLTNEFIQKSTEVLRASEINKKREREGKLSANLILARDAGDHLPEFPQMDQEWDMKFGCFVQMPVEKGIALLTGMEVVEVPLPGEAVDKEYRMWAKLALENIKRYDALYIHIKGPDEPAHDGRYKDKLENIQSIDRYFFTPLLEGINKGDAILTVTADHSTPCKIAAHSADPVPLLIWGAGVDADNVQEFGESAAKKGSLGTILGRTLMSKLVEFAKGK